MAGSIGGRPAAAAALLLALVSGSSAASSSSSSAFVVVVPGGSSSVGGTARSEAASSSSSSPRDHRRQRRLLVPPLRAESGDDDDGPTEEVYGAKFFGGSAVKEELFDPDLEDRAATLLRQEREERGGLYGYYDRFEDRSCFEDDYAASVGRRVQGAVCEALDIDGDADGMWDGLCDEDDVEIANLYSESVRWETPFPRAATSETPLDELKAAKGFYNKIHAAVVGAKTLSDDDDGNGTAKTVAIRWEASVVWPNPWESRVLLTGTSKLTLDSDHRITSQADKLDDGGDDGKDLVGAIYKQLTPRFWDLYHIGMTPSAELSPRLPPPKDIGTPFGGRSYSLYRTPPRLCVSPTVLDLSGREDRLAQMVPNHAFSSIIKTTGPRKQAYVPAGPVEIVISRDDGGNRNRIAWSIPLSVEFLAAAGSGGKLPLPGPDDETDEEWDATCAYKLGPSRLVATVPYGGDSQDPEVSDLREKLYREIKKDGLKPRLDENGRPAFFFVRNDAKACYVPGGGLGMAVYEYRPMWVQGNEVGIELER